MQTAHELPNVTARPGNLEAVLQQIVRKTGVPGISAALVHDGQVTCAAAGLRRTSTPAPMGTESRFMMGSLGKFLFALSAMESIVANELDCDAPLLAYLPELRGCDMGRSVALRHLMSHTSGVYWRADGPFANHVFNADWPSMVQRCAAARPLFAPGAAFSYDAPNYVLCGEILRRLHGAAPRDLIRTRILDPLGIECSGTLDTEKADWFVEGHTATTGGGFAPVDPAVIAEPWESACSSLTISMPDLAKIAATVMDARDTTSAMLSPAARRMLLTQTIELPIAPEWPVRDSALTSYGFGCGGHRNRSLGHPGEGAGQCCALHFDPARGIAVAVGVNALAFNVREAALTMLMRSMGFSKGSGASKRPTFERGELPGNYVGGSLGRVVEVRELDSMLICRLGAAQGTTEPGASDKKIPVIRFHLTDEGHAELDEQSRQFPVCFFREPGGTTPCLLAGAVSYRRSVE